MAFLSKKTISKTKWLLSENLPVIFTIPGPTVLHSKNFLPGRGVNSPPLKAGSPFVACPHPLEPFKIYFLQKPNVKLGKSKSAL